MNDSLQEVMSAAVEAAARKMAGEMPPRRAPLLRAVESGRPAVATAPIATATGADAGPAFPIAAPVAVGAATVTDMADSGPACSGMVFSGMVFSGDDGQLGRGGLRLAFWVCGFNEALRERLRRGERLTEREESLMTLSRKDFALLRPLVIGMALERLHAVVNGPDPCADAGAYRAGTMEAFALEALRNLSHRANQLLREDGPDAALSLFGNESSVQEPLAIFQMVFTTAAGLVEAFDRFVQSDARLLAHLAMALGSEVERI